MPSHPSSLPARVRGAGVARPAARALAWSVRRLRRLAEPPTSYTLIALAVGLACVAAKVEADVGRFGSELLGVLAGASFAAAGVSQVARLWLGPYQRRRTAPIVASRMQQALTAIGNLAARCVEIAGDLTPPEARPVASAAGADKGWGDDEYVRQVLALPRSDASRGLAKGYLNDFRALWFDPPADPQAGARLRASLAARGSAISADLAVIEKQLTAIARDRDAFAVRLDQASVNLAGEVADLISYERVERPDVGLAIGDLMGIFELLDALCSTLDELYAEVSRTLGRPGQLMVPKTAFRAREAAAPEGYAGGDVQS